MARIIKQEDLIQGPNFDDLFYIPETRTAKNQRNDDLRPDNQKLDDQDSHEEK